MYAKVMVEESPNQKFLTEVIFKIEVGNIVEQKVEYE